MNDKEVSYDKVGVTSTFPIFTVAPVKPVPVIVTLSPLEYFMTEGTTTVFVTDES